MDVLRPYLSRIIAPIITFFLAWVAQKTGIVLDNEAITESTVLLLVPILFVVNGIIHKTLDKTFNPGDAASSHLAVSEKTESEDLKK